MSLKVTKKQFDCLLLRSRGLSNVEIAEVLGIDRTTVELRFKTLAQKNGITGYELIAEFVREQCKSGVWE